MAWNSLTKTEQFAEFLGVPPQVLSAARRQRSHVYIEKDIISPKTRKLRHLCYPPPHGELCVVQKAIKECLADLPLSEAVRGYRKGQHNINCAQTVAGLPFVAKLDIKDFHPSICPELVTAALLQHGVSRLLCRIITQLVTHKGGVPQGALTSNHIANLVVDYVLSKGILQFCSSRSVVVVNFGDDTAFGGYDRAAVDECVEYSKRIFGEHNLKANSKSSCAEHVGAERKFIGTSTGRQNADLTRSKFRAYRTELRAALRRERTRAADVERGVSQTEINSFRAKIAYVRRLSRRKARILSEIFYRLCAAKRANLAILRQRDLAIA